MAVISDLGRAADKITSISLKAGETISAGVTNHYEIKTLAGDTFEFSVVNGADGTSGLKTKKLDGTSGNPVTASTVLQNVNPKTVSVTLNVYSLSSPVIENVYSCLFVDQNGSGIVDTGVYAVDASTSPATLIDVDTLTSSFNHQFIIYDFDEEAGIAVDQQINKNSSNAVANSAIANALAEGVVSVGEEIQFQEGGSYASDSDFVNAVEQGLPFYEEETAMVYRLGFTYSNRRIYVCMANHGANRYGFNFIEFNTTTKVISSINMMTYASQSEINAIF